MGFGSILLPTVVVRYRYCTLVTMDDDQMMDGMMFCCVVHTVFEV